MRRLAALLFAVALPAYATPINLEIALTISRVEWTFFPRIGEPDPLPALPIGGRSPVRFTVDDAILATDGRKTSPVTNFYAELGLSVWDQNNHGILGGSDFVGLRGPCPDFPDDFFCYTSVMGFQVLDHQVVGLMGGVFGHSDFPFIDFHGDYFTAIPHHTLNEHGLRDLGAIWVFGSIAAVPEPGTLALVLLGLMGLRRKVMT